MCNYDGKCFSEELRDLLKIDIMAYEEGLELEKEESKIIVEPVTESSRSIVHGKFLDDDGNVLGVF